MTGRERPRRSATSGNVGPGGRHRCGWRACALMLLLDVVGVSAAPDASVEESNCAGWSFESDCFDGVVVGIVWPSSPQVTAGNDAGTAVFCCEVADHPYHVENYAGPDGCGIGMICLLAGDGPCG